MHWAVQTRHLELSSPDGIPDLTLTDTRGISMRKPRILNSLPFTRRKTSSALGGAGARGGAILAFSMEPQKQTNWGWAATSKSVDDYFRKFDLDPMQNSEHDLVRNQLLRPGRW